MKTNICKQNKTKLHKCFLCLKASSVFIRPGQRMQATVMCATISLYFLIEMWLRFNDKKNFIGVLHWIWDQTYEWDLLSFHFSPLFLCWHSRTFLGAVRVNTALLVVLSCSHDVRLRSLLSDSGDWGKSW